MQEVEELAAETKRETDQLAASVTEELVVALAEAADDDEAWASVEDDAKAFLRRRNIDVPDEIQIAPESAFEEEGHGIGDRYCARSIQLYMPLAKSKSPGLPLLKVCVKWEWA